MNYKQKVLQAYITFQIFVLMGLVMPANILSQTQDKKLSAREIAQQTLPSTVSIVVANDKTDEIKSGSGFFVAEDIVVTNYHVIKNSNTGVAKIVGQDKIYEILGTVGIDEKNDLALIKLKGVKGKPLKLNTNDLTAIGDEVYAVGNPQGLEGTFSQGIVSSIRKTDKINLLQITASISQGSSGGAVLNDRGEVIGVAVGGIESGQSLNFAIPVSLLNLLIKNIKPIELLSIENTFDNNKTQSNSTNGFKKPSNFPAGKPKPERASRISFKQSDLLEENFFGSVKSVKESLFIPQQKFGKWELGKPSAISTREYKTDGNKESSSRIVFSENGIDVFDCSLWFLAIGFKKEFPAECKTTYRYDYSNNMIKEDRYIKCFNCSAFELHSSITIQYQENEESRFSLDGEMFLKTIKYKDSEGKNVEDRYDTKGELSSREITYKDKIGLVTKSLYPSKINKDQLKLDRETVTVETQGELRKTFNCDQNGKKVECLEVRDKSTNLTIRNEENQQITTKFEYEFDSMGNWIKQTMFENVTKFGKTFFEPRRIIIREITYY